MYGSYGSYSGMSAPMDIGPNSYLCPRTQDASCAFPSWPRRSSLSDSDREERPSSYLTDEDLFSCDDDARSVSSRGSASPVLQSPHSMTEAELVEMERERAAYRSEVMRSLFSEKERRRQAAKRQHKAGSSGKKGPKTKLSSMTPITEMGE